MISLCFFIFVLSNSATCEIWNNKLTKEFTYGSPGNPMGTVIVNIDGSFRYIFGPGNNNNEDKTTENPATATERHGEVREKPHTARENPATATENPGTATATENPATATENPATENPDTATENPDTTTQRTDITTQEPDGNENNTETPSVVYDSCEDAVREAHKTGVFKIQIPSSIIEPFEVFCMKDSNNGPAWTVIQRRKDGMVNFNQNWSTYESGFGNPHADFFLGLKVIRDLTRRKNYRLKIHLEDWNNQSRFARYAPFSIDNASNEYKIRLGTFDGDAGDGMIFPNFAKFSTYDNDNDNEEYTNCAEKLQTGWWLRGCHQSDLNGPYFADKLSMGMQWDTWHGLNYSLKYAHMAIQPTK